MTTAVLSESPVIERPTLVRWQVMTLACLLALTIYLHRSANGAMRTTIQADFQAAGFDVSEKTMGEIQAAFSWGYLFQILGGIAGIRFGNRWTLTVFALGTALSTLGCGLSTSPTMLWWMTFGIGITQAGIIPCVSQLIKDWIPPERRGTASGLFTSSMSIGGSLALLITGLLLNWLTWSTILALYALVGLVWAAVFAVWFRNRPHQHAWVNRAELELIQPTGLEIPGATSQASWRVWWVMLWCWNQWANCIQQFCRNFFFTFFLTSYPAFLYYAYDVDAERSAMLGAVPLASTIFGGIVGGQLIDFVLRTTGSKWLSRCGISVIGHLMCGVMMLVASRATTAGSSVALIGVAIFFFGFGSPCTWAGTMDIAGKYTSPFIALSNMVGVVAGIYCPIVTGQMFDLAKDGQIPWERVFYLLAINCWIPVLMWLTFDPNRPAKVPE